MKKEHLKLPISKLKKKPKNYKGFNNWRYNIR